MKVIWPLQSVTAASSPLACKATPLNEIKLLNTPANPQETNSASIPRDAAELNYRKQPRQTEVTRNRMRNELIIPVTVIAARASCQWSQQTCYIRQRYYRPAPDKRNDPQRWWKQTGEMERKERGGWRGNRGDVRIAGRMEQGKKRWR